MMTDPPIPPPDAPVTLREITGDAVAAICRLSDTLPEAQRRFVAPNAVSIAQAHFEAHAWFRAIYAGEIPVGFLMLYDDPQAAEYFLWRLMVGGPYQGRGYGRQAMELLIETVRARPGATQLRTSYVPGEGSPEGFYRRLGFEPTGEVEDDEIVMRLSLTPLSPPVEPTEVDVRAHNRQAWNQEVARGNRWTVPVDAETIARARAGDWEIVLTPSIPVPASWWPDLRGCRVLCLASGGGQQGPILAAAGAEVTVYDNSPAQLAQDRAVADREGLSLTLVEGDMRDLSAFAGASFDLIVHPVSNTFVPEVRPVWREAYRVLRPGGALLSGFTHPAMYLFDWELADRSGELVAKYALPYSDLTSQSPEAVRRQLAEGRPIEYSHTLDDQIGGQIEAGFLIAGFYEDRDRSETADPVSRLMGTFVATRAIKGGG